MFVQSSVLTCKSFNELFFYSIEMHKDLLSRLGVYVLINNSGVITSRVIYLDFSLKIKS